MSEYSVYFTNMLYTAEPVFDSIEKAVAYGKSKGFEFLVVDEKKNVKALAQNVNLDVTRYDLIDDLAGEIAEYTLH